MSVGRNISIGSLDQITNRLGFVNTRREEQIGLEGKANFNIKTPDLEKPIVELSGGNQQKAIVAREIDRELPLIVAVQPTRGLDVGAIEYIHKQLVHERDEGKAVLLVSLELDEVMNLSDRILVMYEGEIVGEFDPKQVSVEELGLYMAGAKRQDMEGKK